MNREQQWIKPPKTLSSREPYLKAKLIRPIDNSSLEFQLNTDRGPMKVTVPIESSFSIGQEKDYEDMCQMDVLNEPEVLANLIKRYNKQRIFTCIGPTLIVINPYRYIDNLFGNYVLEQAKKTTLAGKSTDSQPHLYKVAGQAFEAINAKKGKQAIVISGESGAGKTESTKYCVQLLTALGPIKANSIEQRILAANPVLQAFGNSKTVRNENSSRFGKYMSILFDQNGHIIGAKIQNYLLQKSRVVNISKNQRSFHAFYALTASGKWNIKSAQEYRTLKKSECYTSSHMNDGQYFTKINQAFQEIGFKSRQIDKIWAILAAILELGNIDFDDTAHHIDQSKPCTLVGVKQLGKIALFLGTDAGSLEKILLFEKRRFLKQYTFMPYGKASCVANQQALCKALYQSLFEFILQGVQAHLQPNQPVINGMQISILDIFGFENFGQNSFEQFCINFANERLLRLYNDYVFRKQLDILREDGLQEQTVGLVPPSNDTLINLMNGKLSLFSVINDMTLPQFKDQDVINAFHKLQSPHITFDKLNPKKFALSHSPCEVAYSIEGFKVKNQDKRHQDISDLLEKLWGSNKQSSGKTILTKFNKEMDDLMSQLESSQVYFIRCIKPNELKLSNAPDSSYMLTQVRYLGVLQTIFIRKNTFPARKTYKNFKKEYDIVFRGLSKEGNNHEIIKQVMKDIQAKQQDYLLGKVRVYMTSELEERLDCLLYECMKIRQEKAIVIQRNVKSWLFRTIVRKKLKVFVKRLGILKQIPSKMELKIKARVFTQINNYVEAIKLKIAREEEKAKLQMLKQAKQIRQKQKLRHKKQLQKQDDLNESQIGLYQQNPDISESLSGVKEAFKNLVPRQKPNLLANGLMSLILNETDQVSRNPIDPRVPYNKPETPSSNLMGQHLSFNSQFKTLMQIKSEAQFQSPGVLFERQVDPGIYNGTEEQLEKLKSILNQKYKVDVKGNEQDFFSPMSSHCKFKMADLPAALLTEIMEFDIEDFFNRNLRKRTTFFGSKKSYTQILVCKKAPLSKSMTVLSSEDDEKRSIQIFNSILKIGQEENINKVLKYVQSFLEQCQNSSLQLKKQIIVQMIRQSNTPLELSAIRIYQLMTVYLHVYNPPIQTLKATLHLYYWKIKSQNLPTTEHSYLSYLFSCIARKIQKRVSIGYLPYSYQIMGLMCKRQISIPIYLPAGTSILMSIESYHTFVDIKQHCLKEFGISQRLGTDIFGFFEVVNFESEDLQETPIRQTNSIWDMITYWELTKQKYNEGGIAPPTFFILVKLRFAAVLRQEDEELTELCFSQLYYEYFMGRIELEDHLLYILGALIFKIKHTDKKLEDMVMGLLPLYFTKPLKKSQVALKVGMALKQLEDAKLTEKQMKFKFITICSQSQLALAVEIPVEQQYRLFLKPRQLFIKRAQKIETIPLKRLIRWQINKENIVLQVAPGKGETSGKQYTIKTDNASIFNEMLRSLSTQKFGGNQMNRVASFRRK